MTAVRRHDPKVAPIPLVFDSPHSGTDYPADFDHSVPRAMVRQAEDTHVAELYRAAPAQGATLVEALFPHQRFAALRRPGSSSTAHGRVPSTCRARPNSA